MHQRRLQFQAQARPLPSTPLVFVNIVHSKDQGLMVWHSSPLCPFAPRHPCSLVRLVDEPEENFRMEGLGVIG